MHRGTRSSMPGGCKGSLQKLVRAGGSRSAPRLLPSFCSPHRSPDKPSSATAGKCKVPRRFRLLVGRFLSRDFLLEVGTQHPHPRRFLLSSSKTAFTKVLTTV